MIMKRILPLTAAMVIFLTGALPAQEAPDQDQPAAADYADFKAVMRQVLDAVEVFVYRIDRAQTPSEIAEAIVILNTEMSELEPEMEAMDEKYPHITETDYPEELAELMEEYISIYDDMEAASLKMFEYMDDPEVQAAMEMMQ